MAYFCCGALILEPALSLLVFRCHSKAFPPGLPALDSMEAPPPSLSPVFLKPAMLQFSERSHWMTTLCVGKLPFSHPHSSCLP